MTTVFDPKPTLPFCPRQSAMFPFLAEHGFAAITLSEVQGIVAGEPVTGAQFNSWIFVKTGHLHYESIESVPDLVARYAMLMEGASVSASVSAPEIAEPLPTLFEPAQTSFGPVAPEVPPEPGPIQRASQSFAGRNGLWK